MNRKKRLLGIGLTLMLGGSVSSRTESRQPRKMRSRSWKTKNTDQGHARLSAAGERDARHAAK